MTEGNVFIAKVTASADDVDYVSIPASEYRELLDKLAWRREQMTKQARQIRRLKSRRRGALSWLLGAGLGACQKLAI